jgi:phosphatidylglycerophosphate synthase
MPHPNVISVVRALLGLSLVKLTGERRFRLAFAALAAGQLSDPLDGYIARRSRKTSDVGAQLDLVADSVLTFGSFLGLVRAGVVPIRVVLAFATLALLGQYVVQPKTGLPIVLIGSLGYYAVATAVYARLARVSRAHLLAAGGLGHAFIAALEHSRFREILLLKEAKNV